MRIACLVAVAVVVWRVAAPVHAAPRRDRAPPQRPDSADAPARSKQTPVAPVARDPGQVRIAELEREVRGHQLARRSYQTVSPLRKLYSLQRRLLGVTDARTEGTRQQLGAALLATGRYREAVAMYRDGVVIAEQTTGKGSKESAQAMSALISVYWLQGRYPDAEALYQRALPIWKKQYGEISEVYAGVLSGYAGFLSSWSSFGAAQRSYEEALRIYEALARSPDDVSLVAPLQALASLYWNTGSQPRAMTLFNRVLAINDHRPKGEAQARASMVFSIASVYHHGGRPDLAKPLFERSRAIYREEIAAKEQAGAKGYEVSSLYIMVAMMEKSLGELAAARKAMTRAIAIEETVAGGSSWYGMLADIERADGAPRLALALIDKAERHLIKIAGSSMKAIYAPTRAEILRELGRHDEAERVLRQYLRKQQKLFGARHPIVGGAHVLLASLSMAAGRPANAEASLAKGLDLAERELSLILSTGSEADHVVYFHRNAHIVDMALNLHLRDAPNSRRAAELAMTTVLRRKGRILDASAGAMAALRGRLAADDVQALEQLDELDDARATLAKLIVAGPDVTGPEGYAKEVAQLDIRVRELEEHIRTRSAAYRAISQPIELAAVQAALGGDTRLVEIVTYQPYDIRYDLKNLPPRRYAAYVVAHRGAAVAVDLGPVQTLDVAVEQFRTAVADPDDDRVIERGRALYDLTLGKIVPRLGGATKIALAPDGQLNLVSFAALVEPSGGFVLQRFTVTYLTSGRDLLRAAVTSKPHGGAIIVADPAFDGGQPPGAGSAPVSANPPRSRRSRDLVSSGWRSLPGTGEEAEAIQRVLAGAVVLRGNQATEAALKAVRAPSILHVATHGFFLPGVSPQPFAAPANPRSGEGPSMATAFAPPADSAAENPLLRSGLALAGANALHSGAEDGILTALEASGLNLWGTQLVVLSACETGVGKASDGEGVYGLRRALVIAGAQSLVMSLWQVDDVATRDLMTRFYRKLESGSGRSEALRAAQLQTLGERAHHHPYYWAAFQPSGASSPIKEWR